MRPVRLRPGKLPPDLLQRLVTSYTRQDPRIVVPPGLGEDAAVIDFGGRYLVAKTDPITFATDAIGWYAVQVNANDIAAMGAVPRFFLATIILPEQEATESLVESIFRSIHEAAEELDITVCGGHTEISHGIDRPIVVGHMLGEVQPDQLVRSSDLRPGDELILTKGLAIEATAIIARERREELLTRGLAHSVLDTAARFLMDPGISVVQDARIAASAGGVRAMHDPTEGGVATALRELAAAAGVGLTVERDNLYLASESSLLCAEYDLDPLGVISSGALLIGCAKSRCHEMVAALRAEGIAAAHIGSVCPADQGLTLTESGRARTLPSFPVDEITRIFEG